MSVEALGGGASVGSSDRSGGNNVGDEWSIEMDLRFSEEEKKLFVSFEKASKVVNETGLPADPKPKIQKVPSILRGNKILKKYFEPKMFSFGPYSDYPDEDRTPEMENQIKMAEKIKVRLAADFLQHNGVEKKVLYEEIMKEINRLKDCYDEELTEKYIDKDHELAWMFLVDGCAILQFINISVGSSKDLEDSDTQLGKLGIKFDYTFFLVHDLFLLENQLPYQLLQLIVRRASKQQPHKKEKELQESKQEPDKKERELLESIYKFIFSIFRQTERWSKNKDEILKDLKHDHDHVHLLHLLRKMLIQPLDHIHKKHDFTEIIMGWTLCLFDNLRCNRNEYRVPVPFRNIGKLREAGINLKPSETSCVTGITFIGGTLKLPPISLDESTASTFFNILGYEMCPNFPNKSEFITYMYFMDKLIDRTQDVEELREKNILRNQPGSDEEVVKLFNEIVSHCHLFPSNEIYYEV